MKDEDAEAEDDQTKKKECEDCDRDEEDVESEYSMDDESIFTKAGISSTHWDGQESDTVMAHWSKVWSEALLGVGQNLLCFVCLLQYSFWF